MPMIEHPLHPNKQFFMSDKLYNNLVPLKKRIEKNKDVTFLVVGEPGNGKSTITSQILYVLDPSIIERNIVYTTTEDYMRECLRLQELNQTKGKAIMHDEGRELGGMNVVKSNVRKFWDFIYENRFLNMYHALVHSDFFKTPQDVINFRARFMVWVVENQNWDNGLFYFFGRKDMRELYFNGKKSFNKTPRGYSFQDKFGKFWAGEPNYEERKASNFHDKYSKALGENKALRLLYRTKEIVGVNKTLEIYEISRKTLYDRLEKYEGGIN